MQNWVEHCGNGITTNVSNALFGLEIIWENGRYTFKICNRVFFQGDQETMTLEGAKRRAVELAQELVDEAKAELSEAISYENTV